MGGRSHIPGQPVQARSASHLRSKTYCDKSAACCPVATAAISTLVGALAIMTTLLPPAIAGLVLALALVMTPGLPATLAAQSGAVSPAAELRIGGSVETPLVLSAADLRKMPRKTLKVVNPHEKKSEVYEGVALEELLRRAGAVQGERLRGPALAMYVLAEACDGYRVVFSLAELDSAIVDSDIIVADTVDGGPLGPKQGPFRIVAPHDKRPARWVRMLKSLTVVKTPN